MLYTIKLSNKEIKLKKSVFEKQNINNKSDIIEIKQLYVEKYYIEEAMKVAMISNLKEYNKLWWNVERQIQDKMKYQKNDNFIKFWLVPKCTCPKEVNNLKFPLGNYVIDKNCIVHS